MVIKGSQSLVATVQHVEDCSLMTAVGSLGAVQSCMCSTRPACYTLSKGAELAMEDLALEP